MVIPHVLYGSFCGSLRYSMTGMGVSRCASIDIQHQAGHWTRSRIQSLLVQGNKVSNFFFFWDPQLQGGYESVTECMKKETYTSIHVTDATPKGIRSW